MTKSLVTALIPFQLLQGFDQLCHVSGISRTSALIRLMRRYVLEDSKRVIRESRIIGAAARKGFSPPESNEIGKTETTSIKECLPAQRRSLKKFTALLDELEIPVTAATIEARLAASKLASK